MAVLYFDTKEEFTNPLTELPKGAIRAEFVKVTHPVPTCCRSQLYDWAICYVVPGDLRNLSRNLPAHCDDHAHKGI